jgi:hypothetical protein
MKNKLLFAVLIAIIFFLVTAFVVKSSGQSPIGTYQFIYNGTPGSDHYLFRCNIETGEVEAFEEEVPPPGGTYRFKMVNHLPAK